MNAPAASAFSPLWESVSERRPALRKHVRISRQRYRGELWYVLLDRSSGRLHRFTPATYLVITLLDGQRTVQEIWDAACARLGDQAPTQDDVIRLLAQLHTADVLTGDIPPDIDEVTGRSRRMRRRKSLMRFMNPMAVRIPLVDPDRFLEASLPLVRPLISLPGLLAFIALVGTALVQVALHWSELTNDILDRVLSAENLLILVLIYPVIKALHELGHGYVTKRWGGEVHEIGIMFLVFMPVPYIDASSASEFPSKWQRALVGGAGIMVEVAVASIAMLVWANAEPGLVRAIAYNALIIGGVSTVFFNGNPLLRFDGYYVLSDMLDIPNLGPRSLKYLRHLCCRYLFSMQSSPSPASSRGEARWFALYGVPAFLYRLFVLTAIVMIVAGKFFVVGVLIAIWGLVLMVGIPVVRGIRFVCASPALRGRRGRAIAAAAAVVAALLVPLIMVPLPHATVTEGIVWGSGETAIHAQADGTIAELLAAPNSQVSRGDELLRLTDPLLEAEVAVLRAGLHELELRYQDRDFVSQVDARILAEQLRHARADLARAEQRQLDLVVRSPGDGQLLLPRAEDLIGQFMRRGTVLGHVAKLDEPIVRVIVPEGRADLVKRDTRKTSVRFVERIESPVRAEILREVPTLSVELPSLALSTVGGGRIALDPTQPDQARALMNLVHIELEPAVDGPVAGIGERVYVRFSHTYEPLAFRIARAVRQVFLRRFNV